MVNNIKSNLGSVVDKYRENNAVSPVIGVTLMVAVVVILAGIIGIFVIDLGSDTDNEASAGVTIDEQPNQTEIQWISSGNSEDLLVQVNDGEDTSEFVLTEVGDTVNIVHSQDAIITVIGFTDEGDDEGTVIQSVETEFSSGEGTELLGANFEIIEFNILNEELEQGDVIEAEITVRNNTTDELTRSVGFSAGGSSASGDVTVSGGETNTVNRSFELDEVGELTATASVGGEDEESSQTIIVEQNLEEAFTVEDVEQGEEMNSTLELTNTGDEEDTQNIELEVEGEGIVDSEEVTLEPEDTQTIALDWQTDVDQPTGDYDVTAITEDDSVTKTVTVFDSSESQEFSVSITEVDSPVEQGDTTVVTYEAINDEDEEVTQTIELDVEDEGVVDSEEVTVSANDTEEQTLEWTTDDEQELKEYTVTIEAEDSTSTDEVEVEESETADFVFETTEEFETFEEEWASELVPPSSTVENDKFILEEEFDSIRIYQPFESGTEVDYTFFVEESDSEGFDVNVEPTESTFDLGISKSETFEGEGEKSLELDSTQTENPYTTVSLQNNSDEEVVIDRIEVNIDLYDETINNSQTSDIDSDGNQTLEFNIDGDIENTVYSWTPDMLPSDGVRYTEIDATLQEGDGNIEIFNNGTIRYFPEESDKGEDIVIDVENIYTEDGDGEFDIELVTPERNNENMNNLILTSDRENTGLDDEFINPIYTDNENLETGFINAGSTNEDVVEGDSIVFDSESPQQSWFSEPLKGEGDIVISVSNFDEEDEIQIELENITEEDVNQDNEVILENESFREDFPDVLAIEVNEGDIEDDLVIEEIRLEDDLDVNLFV